MTTHPMLDLSLWGDATPDETLVIADGRSATIGVRDGCLVITDGPRNERKRTFVKSKGARAMRHLMILAEHGYVSLEGFRWLQDNGVTWVMVDQSGYVVRDHAIARTLGTSAGYVDPMLERRQAMCYAGMPMEEKGVAIVRQFLNSKLNGQAWVAEHKLDNKPAAKYIRDRITDAEFATTVKTLGSIEGAAAAEYWAAWKGLAPQWRKPAPLKPHWLNYPGRASLSYVHENNRNAADPVNAMLNYGYQILETECTLALYKVSLSPTMGISHLDLADRRRRNAMSLDLMEGTRPVVDEVVLGMLAEPIDKRLFSENAQGVVTLEAPLTHKLAARIHERAYRVMVDVNNMLGILTA